MKVSVIVPVYMVESFIERCIRSLLEQTLREVEFIIVDDCSLDESINIARRVVREYPDRVVKFVHHSKIKGCLLHAILVLKLLLVSTFFIVTAMIG